MTTGTITLVTALFGSLFLGFGGLGIHILHRLNKLTDTMTAGFAEARDRDEAAELRAVERHLQLLALIADVRQDNRGLDSRISRVEGQLKIQPVEANQPAPAPAAPPTPAQAPTADSATATAASAPVLTTAPAPAAAAPPTADPAPPATTSTPPAPTAGTAPLPSTGFPTPAPAAGT